MLSAPYDSEDLDLESAPAVSDAGFEDSFLPAFDPEATLVFSFLGIPTLLFFGGQPSCSLLNTGDQYSIFSECVNSQFDSRLRR